MTLSSQVENVKRENGNQQADNAKEPSKAIGCMEQAWRVPWAKHKDNKRKACNHKGNAENGIN
ncbi:MAG: hypothetical protein CL512_05810 [Actinobacteria bacterium]|nr:hypothetical protein [Actinomycetota bacterium]